MEERRHHRETLLPSSLLKTMGRKRSRSESSSSSLSSSSTSTEDEERKRKKSKLKKEKKHKGKKEEKKRKKEKKKPKKSRKGEQKDTRKESITSGVEEPPPRKAVKSLPPSAAAGGAAAAVPKSAELPPVQRKAMVPMTKEEYEKQQSVVREVYDPETGRMRLVKGTGEIIERIVTQQEQRQINKMATQGDGLSFQAKLLSTLQQQG